MDTKKERRQLLTAALRSGEFEQADGHLRTRAGYCCLGVACEIFRRETDRGQWVVSRHMDEVYEFGVDGDGGHSVLPEAVRDWFGFESLRGLMGHRSLVQDIVDDPDDDVPTDDLTELNDYGVSFNKIADVIDAEPAGLVAS